MLSALSTFCGFSNLSVVGSFHTTVGARLLQTLVSSVKALRKLKLRLRKHSNGQQSNCNLGFACKKNLTYIHILKIKKKNH